jgi:hypothetical protein
MATQVSVSARQLESLGELALHLRHAEGGCLLVAAASDDETQSRLTQDLMGWLGGEITFLSFRFRRDRLPAPPC